MRVKCKLIECCLYTALYQKTSGPCKETRCHNRDVINIGVLVARRLVPMAISGGTDERVPFVCLTFWQFGHTRFELLGLIAGYLMKDH